MFLLNFVSKNESCRFYISFFQFCILLCSQSSVALGSHGDLEFHYLLIGTPAVYIKTKRKQPRFYLLMSTFMANENSKPDCTAFVFKADPISWVAAEGTVLSTAVCIILFLKTPMKLKVVDAQTIFRFGRQGIVK